MSRPLRIEFNNAWYHVMNRGSGRQKIFKTDAHRNYFLSLLNDTFTRFNADWHAYCLMENHYHLLVRTPEGNLQRIMRHLNGVYTQYYNRNEKTDGALFRGRYKAILVDADAYWLQLSRYIHRNPIAAGMVNDLPEYHWSSYRAYVGLEPKPVWLSTGYIRDAIGSVKGYVSYVEQEVDDKIVNFYSGKKQSPILGNKSFRQRVLSDTQSSIDQPDLNQARPHPTVTEIVRATAAYYSCDAMGLYLPTRGKGVKSPARSVAMYLCQEVSGLTLTHVAKDFGLASYASAGSSIRKVRLKIRDDRDLSNSINLIKLDLTP